MRLFDILSGEGWLELIKTLASITAVGIAFLALQNWKRQDRAKREAEFLDALVEATNTYIVEMARPIVLVRMCRTGMMSHVSLFDERDEGDRVAEGIIPYIKKDGKRDAEQLMSALSEARATTIKLRSLAVKGQLFGFRDYAKCRQSVENLLWQFDRVGAFMTIIGSPTLNWAHPDVQQSLKNVMTLTEIDIQRHISENNIAIIQFVQRTYASLYGARGTPKRVRLRWYRKKPAIVPDA